MSTEQEHPQSESPPGIQLTGIYLDLPRKTVVLAAGVEIVGALSLTESGIIFDARPRAVNDLDGRIEEAAEVLTPGASSPPTESVSSETEKPKAVTLQGKLKSKPQPGRPDSRGNKTAWARFAAHEEDRDGAHLYSTTFHKHTVEIALGLDKDTSLTVQGYPHLQEDPGTKRLDTLSVINLLEYPGKSGK
ncbi:MAG: hypothetical protein NVSMB27_05640 [Ktedonobacteraceae bacterium]